MVYPLLSFMHRMKKRLLAGLVFLLLVAGLVFLDQWTKQWAVENLKQQPSIPFLPGVLCFQYLENSGMAFGLFKGQMVFFYLFTSLLLALLCFVLIRLPLVRKSVGMAIGLCLTVAGAIGNFIDRIANGYVVDFIQTEFMDFPVFNVADCYVTIGMLLLLVLLLFVYSEEDLKTIFSIRKKKE